MPDGLYDRDILVWSEQQADLLRRIAAGERLNGQVDWANVIEELEDVGRSELHSCESLLTNAMIHLLKLHFDLDSRDAANWQDEIAAFLSNARRRFVPSMRQRIDLADLYSDARKARPQARPDCPFSLDELLDRDADVQVLVAKLGGAA